MNWLMQNAIATMAGPQFLLLFAVVAAVTLLASWWWMRQSDPTANLPALPVPTSPDPYEIAYLRGGENEVLRLALFRLIQGGCLRVTEERKWWGTKEQRVERTGNVADRLSTLEREVLAGIAAHTAQEVFQDAALVERVKAHCTCLA